MVDEAQVLADLRDAVATGQLSVDYQPVVRVSDRVTTGVEALVRWEHPLRGRLRPSDFLDLASRTGLLLPLGDRVLRQACHAIAGWNREALDGRALQVSVNLSAQQLLQPGLRGLVQEALVVAECRPEWLALEVTEAAITSDEQAAAAALDALRSLGVAVALDDAGTGVGSSTWLRRYGFDVLKIDRSFVAGLGLGDGRGDVVASLVSLAGRLGVRCVAEGVETVGQLALLQGLGCELAQGYLFSRPMSAEDTTTWLQRATAPVRPQPGAEAAGVPVSSLQRALELHAEGASLHTVAARLNLEGRLAAKGRRWHHTSVARMLAGHQFPQLRV